MNRSKALQAKWQGLAPLLQRRLWQPLRNMMNVFHVLPLTAAVILFALLATEGQFREIYIAYLEGPGDHPVRWIVGIVAALGLFALLSALLSETHYSLSTMRINIVYSSYSNPDANSTLRRLQRSAAFCLAMSPWLGLTTGLFVARNFVADRYCQLLGQNVPDLATMQHVLQPNIWTMAAAILFLGASTTAFATVNQQTRIAQRVVAFVAPPFMALLFLLFTDRLNADILKSSSLWTIVFIILATVLYFDIYQRLYRRRTRLIFYARTGSSTGISVRKLRWELLVLWAFLPWLLFALYFVVAPRFATASSVGQAWSTCPFSGTGVPVPGPWAIFGVAMCCTVAVGLLVGLWLNRVSDRWLLRRMTTAGLVLALAVASIVLSFLDANTIVSVYRLIGPLAAAALLPLFLIATLALLAWLSQKSGFPALTLVVLAAVICVMFPNYIGLTAFALGVVCVIFGLVAFLSRLFAVTLVALILPLLGVINWHQLHEGNIQQNSRVGGKFDPQSVTFQFECWLNAKGIALPANDKFAANQNKCASGATSLASLAAPVPTGVAKSTYPVFIIAAEGGGIYAASAAAAFLAKIQDAAPNFAEHVFAISGVSGGAIGTTIFQALTQAEIAHQASTATAADDPPTRPGCPAYAGELPVAGKYDSLTDKVKAIMEDDHFSPVVGSIFPELLGSATGRAEALTASFDDSVAARDRIAGQCLHAPFANHWADTAAVPALVLNSTWVETGFRVAFAPFHLHDIDESLYSFSDQLMPDEGCPAIPNEQSCVSLMQAAIVSARFPLILPPFSAVLRDSDGKFKRWNFVDGGYSDNSGATTALALYDTLKSVAPSNVDLHIVLITSADPQPDLRGADINGTLFRDTLAPIDALMTVRENLGNEAVARACSAIYPQDAKIQRNAQAVAAKAGAAANEDTEQNDICIQHAWQQPAPPLQIVQIQDETYGLSLGWKISQTSFDVVSWMLGTPTDNCPGKQPGGSNPTAQQPESNAPATDKKSLLTQQIVELNSCVMQSIVALVGGERRPATSPIQSPKTTVQ